MYNTLKLTLFILIFLWVSLLHSSVSTSVLEGVTVVHLIDDLYSNEDGTSPVITEIHLSGAALGKQVFEARGLKMYPVLNTPTYNILHSERNVSFVGSWVNQTVPAEDLNPFWIKIGELLYQSDSESALCDDSSSDLQCFCPNGYKILEKGKCIKNDDSCNYFLNAFSSGKFETPNFPRDYPIGINCTWTIKASPGCKIELVIPGMVTEPTHDVLYVHDISESREDELGRFSGSIKKELISNGNILRVTFKSDPSYAYRGGEVFYTVLDIPDHLINLEEDEGSIILEQFSFNSEVCLSVIYNIFTSGAIDVYAINNEEDQIMFKEENLYENNGWHISRFVSTEYFRGPVNIYINMTGKGSGLYRIVECDGSASVDVYSNKYGADFGSPVKAISVLSLLKIPTSEPIVTTLAFHRFEEWKESFLSKCDKNHYGPECKEKCSGFESGCKKMIFCHYLDYPNMCSCASGLNGLKCDEECYAGSYGANCHLECGFCKSGSCNPYTGKCMGECIDGYHFPYCQEKLSYMKYAPTASIVISNSVTVSASFSELLGNGSPYLYQVQYKEEHGDWIEMQPIEILRENIVHTIRKLKSGTKYFVRIIIICKDGNSYQGSDIPFLEVITHCLDEDEEKYEISVADITSSSFSLKWKRKLSKFQESSILTAPTARATDLMDETHLKFCPVTEYKVILHERWRRFTKTVSPSDALSVTFTDLLPAHQYKVHMCALGVRGIQFCSSARTVFTAGTGVEEVGDLQVNSLQGGSLNVSWSSFSRQSSDTVFKVNYQCMKLLLCEDTCNDSGGALETSSTFIEIHNLVPLAQYRLRLSASSITEGSYFEKFATTKSAKPTVSPQLLPEPVLFISNSSCTLGWNPPNCFGLNGNLEGYLYRLIQIDSGAENKTVQDGETEEEHVALNDLTPQTKYQFEVYAVNAHGWNPDYKLSIDFVTTGTVPEAVEDLVVYKKGRRMLGIRWAPPTRLYGILKSFKIAYRDEKSKTLLTDTLDPTPCASWHNLYCHTINNLRPDRNYTVFVSAQNKEINEDGQVSTVHGYTRENAPSAPTYLNISESTPDSLVLHWGVPILINGELRAFLVNIEHVESLNDGTCCEYFPVLEVPVSEELPSYSLKISNLSPTSTYIISVTAKTTTLGPSITITHTTPPAPPSSISPPQLIREGEDNASYYVTIQPVSEVVNFDCTYLVLVLHNNDNMPVSNISNVVLKEKLDGAVNHRFYITSEFRKNELLDEQEITIGTGEADVIGETGILRNPKLVPGFYEVALAVIIKNGESVSIGLATSDTFEIK